MVRAFLAIDLPETLKKELSKLSKLNSFPKGKFKWVEEENFHITLKFLGNIRENQIKKIEEICREVAKEFKKFELEVGEVGRFPERGKPRVMWLGVEKGSEVLQRLAETLQRILKQHKIINEKEDYHPHITFLRIKELEDEEEFEVFVKRIAEVAKDLKGMKFKVNEIILFKSELSSQGPKYTPLFKIELAE